MKAILLQIELPRQLEYCQDQVDALYAVLPAGSQKVMHAGQTVAFLILPSGLVEELRAKLHRPLSAFRNYRIFGLTGETVCKDGSMDPVENWMNNHGLKPYRREPRKTQHVPLTERRQPWGKPTL